MSSKLSYEERDRMSSDEIAAWERENASRHTEPKEQPMSIHDHHISPAVYAQDATAWTDPAKDTQEDATEGDAAEPMLPGAAPESLATILARRLYIATVSVRTDVTYAKAEKRIGEQIKPEQLRGYEIIARKILAAIDESISERLLSSFS